jgi:D-alanyl-D-alanine carboxypeptidase
MMIADAAPPRKPTAKARTAKAAPHSSDGLIASAEAATPATEQGDASTSLAALPPNRASRVTIRPGHTWSIQVGAFSTQGPAQRIANKAKSKLPKTLKGASVAVTLGGDDLYRARLVNLTERQAHSACKQLISRGMACITVTPALDGPDAG